MRFSISLPVSMKEDEIRSIVLADERAKKWIGGAIPSKVIVVPKRIINIVVKS